MSMGGGLQGAARPGIADPVIGHVPDSGGMDEASHPGPEQTGGNRTQAANARWISSRTLRQHSRLVPASEAMEGH